jgi:hypothetical protein
LFVPWEFVARDTSTAQIALSLWLDGCFALLTFLGLLVSGHTTARHDFPAVIAGDGLVCLGTHLVVVVNAVLARQRVHAILICVVICSALSVQLISLFSVPILHILILASSNSERSRNATIESSNIAEALEPFVLTRVALNARFATELLKDNHRPVVPAPVRAYELVET